MEAKHNTINNQGVILPPQNLNIPLSQPTSQGTHLVTHWGQDDIFKHIFINENVEVLIKIPLEFIPKGPLFNNNMNTIGSNNGLALTSNKLLLEPVMA